MVISKLARIFSFIVLSCFSVACTRTAGHTNSKKMAVLTRYSSFTLSLQHFLPWSESLAAAPTKLEKPPGGSFLQLAGPDFRMVRTHLQFAFGKDRQLGLVLNGTGEAQAQVFDLNREKLQTLALAGPMVLPLNNDHLLVANSEGLHFLNGDGSLIKSQESVFGFLAAASGNKVWTAGKSLQMATLLDAKGEVKGHFPARIYGRMVSDAEGRLCYFGKNKTEAAGLRCLDTKGVSHLEKGFSLSALDQILGFGQGQLLTTGAGGIEIQARNAAHSLLPLLAGGKTDDGEAFISGFEAEKGQVSLNIAGRKAMALAVPAKYRENSRPYYAVAVEKDEILVRGDAWMLRYTRDGKLLEAKALDDSSYETELFPRLWEMHDMLGWGGEEVFISCSGPEGIAILKLELN